MVKPRFIPKNTGLQYLANSFEERNLKTVREIYDDLEDKIENRIIGTYDLQVKYEDSDLYNQYLVESGSAQENETEYRAQELVENRGEYENEEGKIAAE